MLTQMSAGASSGRRPARHAISSARSRPNSRRHNARSSLNVCAYVGNDPINLTDPLGLECTPDTWVCGSRPDPIGGVGSEGSGPTPGANTASGDDSIYITARHWKRTVTGLWSDFKEGLRTGICSIPAFGWGGGADLYAGVGGSLSGGYSFDIAHGRIGVFYSTGVGVGVGGGAYTALYANPPTGISASLSGNVGVGVGPYGLGYSRGIIGMGTGENGVSAARSQGASARAGATFTLNANVSADGSLGVKLYDAGCE